MVVTADEWTTWAMRDREVVAELLIRLKGAKVRNPTLETLRWGIRQPRSRSPRKEADSAKNTGCSPSTPFSWSGGYGGCSSSSSFSPSAYVDGYDVTSRRISSSFAVGSRSKNIASVRSPFSENKKMKLNTKFSTSLSDGNFLLPDLNIVPCDEHCVETTLYEISVIR